MQKTQIKINYKTYLKIIEGGPNLPYFLIYFSVLVFKKESWKGYFSLRDHTTHNKYNLLCKAAKSLFGASFALQRVWDAKKFFYRAKRTIFHFTTAMKRLVGHFKSACKVCFIRLRGKSFQNSNLSIEKGFE